MALKYNTEVVITLPRERVIALFDDPANMKHWQPGFISFEPISGTPGQPGAKSRLKYKMGNREIEMIETITKRALPDEFNGIYEAKGVYNEQVNRFIALDDNRTKWVSESLFEFSGFMKLIGWLMPASFKKQSQKYLDLFRDFAEKQGTGG